MCASYELGEALIEKGICMLNSLFIHIRRPANLNYKRIMKKKRKIWEPEFHICCVPIFCSFTKRNSFIGGYSRHGQHFIELLWWHQIGFSVFALHLYSIVVFSFFLYILTPFSLLSDFISHEKKPSRPKFNKKVHRKSPKKEIKIYQNQWASLNMDERICVCVCAFFSYFSTKTAFPKRNVQFIIIA